MPERTGVVIVGGGLTGLALGYELAGLKVPHVVLEAEEDVGGVIRSRYVDGHLLETGPQRARLTESMARLVDSLGLSARLIQAPAGLPLFVYRSGRLRTVPFSAGAFLRSDIVSRGGKLRLLAEPFTAGADPLESVARYLGRKVGRELYEGLLGPLYGGLYASDPADMIMSLSLGHVLREFGVGRSLLLSLLRRGGAIRPPSACSFQDGLQELPRALREANASNVRTGTAAQRLGRGDGWVVEHSGGALLADRVVITSPAPAAARLLASPAGRASDAIGRLRYNHLAVVHLYAPDSGLRGLGYQVAFGEKLATRGVTFNESLFGRKGVFTAYLGGATSPEVARMPDGAAATLAVEEFRKVTGVSSSAIAVTREQMPAWDRTWSAIQKLELPEGLHIASNWSARPGIPGRLAQAQRLARQLAQSAAA